MKLLLIVTCASFITFFARAQLRQVGGKDVSVRQYPFVAAIAYTRQLVGNGAIITPNWILTSASAVYHYPDSEYSIAVGTDDFHSPANWHEVSKIIRHPEFVGWDNNIAMVLVRDTVKYGDTVKPINIATNSPDTVEVTMLSYGKNEHSTTHLRAATYTLISDNVDCVGLLKESAAKEIIWRQHGFCLIPPPGTEQGQWYNDAGAPLVAHGELYAVFALAEHEGGLNEGSVAIRVASYLGWIQAVMFSGSDFLK
ncbi:chymotrypsin-1-like [Anopheles stephensi]|uniref:chymotrypsin-1-like n=1 Tax=Anopheles stephensi TaxID=30069 RepID=UPI00165893A5|nr:chymotrypsin-1-like [Anopheles stephensi]